MKICEEKKREAIRIGLSTPFWRFAQEIAKNKEKFQHGAGTCEGYDDGNNPGWVFLGLSGIYLMFALFLSLAIFIWAIIAIIKYAKDLPTWALVVAIVFLFFPYGAIVSLLVTYLAKSNGKKGKFSFS